MGGRLRFAVLGPIAVSRGDDEVVLPRRRQRLVLARLLIDPGRVVPTERLAEEIWGPAGRSSASGSVRTNVWELRRLLGSRNGAGDGDGDAGSQVLASRDGGYVLDVDGEQIDSHRFERHLAQARSLATSGRAEAGVDAVDQALRLYRGPAFDDLAGELPLQLEAGRLDELVLEAQELRAELLLTTGRHVEVAAELGALARANPERERLWGLLMTALYRSGRQGDALRCYQEARSSLVDALGVEPGPALRQLEQAILEHDVALDWHPPATPTTPATQVTPVTPTTPARRAAPARHHNLPRPLTPLVGRAVERAAVAEALDRSRLVSLVGPGGSGKTRLSIAVAEDLLPRFPGGVWFVDLACASTAGSVPGAVAAAVGPEAGQLGPESTAAGTSSTDDEALLVLDNCEHLLDPVADYVTRLLDATPGLRVLTTSREELRVTGETVYRVGGLGLPSAAGEGPFMGSEAVELFVRRGAASLTGFAPTGGTLELVARICRRLDGLPLAIELSAPLVGTLPMAEIARRVEERCSSLGASPRRGLPRHRTLTAAVDWSFDLLDEPTQELFVQLGVFAGSFTLRAIEAVVGQGGDTSCLVEGLAALVRASLLERVAGPDGVTRYRMLETLREYAVDRLEQRPDVELLRERHARVVAELAVAADRGMRGPASSRWQSQVEAELPNVRAALQWAMARHDVELALGILSALSWFLSRLASPEELDQWLDDCGTDAEALTPDLRLRLLTASSLVSLLRGRNHPAGEMGREAAAVARRLGDDHHLAIALVACAAAALASGDVAGGRRHLEEAGASYERLGDRWGLGWVHAGRGTLAYITGRSDEARRHMTAALDTFRTLGDLHSQVFPLGALALLTLDTEDREAAVELATEAVQIVTVLEFEVARHAALGVLGLAHLAAGHPIPARASLLASLRHRRSDQDNPFLRFDLEGLAVLAVGAGSFEAAAKLLGLARQRRLPDGGVSTPRWESAVEVVLDLIRRRLGPEEADTCLTQGRHLDVDDAVTLAEAATTLFS